MLSLAAISLALAPSSASAYSTTGKPTGTTITGYGKTSVTVQWDLSGGRPTHLYVVDISSIPYITLYDKTLSTKQTATNSISVYIPLKNGQKIYAITSNKDGQNASISVTCAL